MIKLAVRNTNLGGTDFNDGEVLYAADLNDTFNAFGNVWFVDGSNAYTVYDDFATELSATLWTISGTAIWSDTTYAGNTQGEAKIGRNTDAIASDYIETKSLTANRSYHANVYFTESVISSDGVCAINASFSLDGGTTNYQIFADSDARADAAFCASSILVINTAENTYDIYVGGKLVGDGVVIAAPQMRFTSSYTNNNGEIVRYLYVDDVRMSNLSYPS